MSEYGEEELEEELSEQEEEPEPVKAKSKAAAPAPAQKSLATKRKKPEPVTPSESSTPIESESYHSSELEELEEELAGNNAHGFVYAHDLVPSKLTKSERLEQQKNEEKDKFQHKKRDRKNKNAGSTNKDKLKNKAFAMLLPKKVLNDQLARDNMTGMKKKKDKNALHQLGHFSKQKRQ